MFILFLLLTSSFQVANSVTLSRLVTSLYSPPSSLNLQMIKLCSSVPFSSRTHILFTISLPKMKGVKTTFKLVLDTRTHSNAMVSSIMIPTPSISCQRKEKMILHTPLRMHQMPTMPIITMKLLRKERNKLNVMIRSAKKK